MPTKIVIRMELKFNSPYENEWYKAWLSAIRTLGAVASVTKKDSEYLFWLRITGKGFVVWLSDPQVLAKSIKIISNKSIPKLGYELIDQIVEETKISLKQHNAYCEIVRDEIESG